MVFPALHLEAGVMLLKACIYLLLSDLGYSSRMLFKCRASGPRLEQQDSAQGYIMSLCHAPQEKQNSNELSYH